MNRICRDCWRWSEFKEKCMFYYESKSSCSKFSIAPELPEQFIDEKFL